MMLFNGVIVAVLIQLTSHQITDATLPVHERIRLLKFKIQEELRGMQKLTGSGVGPVMYADAEYEELKSKRVTPISIHHKNHNFKLKKLITPSTTTEKEEPRIQRSEVDIERSHLNAQPEKEVDSFYRRWLLDPESRMKRLKWVHCEDVVTPYLMGNKKEFSTGRVLGYKDRVVQRLISLIKLNVTLYSKQDIEAMMHQISEIPIRLVNWNSMAIKLLLSTLTGHRVHTFTNIKIGLKKLFTTWHLDLSNTTSLLKQAKIFRPYCYEPNTGGSTKSSKFTMYTTPSPKTTNDCGDSDEDVFVRRDNV